MAARRDEGEATLTGRDTDNESELTAFRMRPFWFMVKGGTDGYQTQKEMHTTWRFGGT